MTSWLAGLVVGLLASGYGVLFALLDDLRDDYGISETKLGIIVGVGFVSAFAAQVTLGPLADRGKARPLVIGGLLLNIAAMVVMALATTFTPLFIGRVLMGVGIGVTNPALRRIVILIAPDDIGRNLGRLLSADVAGFALGPAVAAVLIGPFDLGLEAPFVFIGVATAVALPFVARLDVPATEEISPKRFAFDLLGNRAFAGAVALGCAVFLMIGTFDALWSLALDDLDTAEWIATLGISLFALPLIFCGSIGGRLAQRVGPFRVATIGLTLGSGFMLLYGLVPSGAAMFAVAMIHAWSDGLSFASTGVAVGLVVPPERMAGAQGVLGGMQVLVAGVFAVVAAAVYESFGRTTAYASGAAMMALTVVIGVVLARHSFGLRGVPATELTVPAAMTAEPAVVAESDPT